jgi:hypothetical protein
MMHHTDSVISLKLSNVDRDGRVIYINSYYERSDA